MASAAVLRCAARSLRLRQPLEPERCRLARQFLSSSSSSSSVPTERDTSPSSNKPLKGSMEQKSHVYVNPENVYKQVLKKVDKILECQREHSRLIKEIQEIQAEINENKKHGGAIDLTPWVVSMSSCFLLFGLYKYLV